MRKYKPKSNNFDHAPLEAARKELRDAAHGYTPSEERRAEQEQLPTFEQTMLDVDAMLKAHKLPKLDDLEKDTKQLLYKTEKTLMRMHRNRK